MNVNEPTDPVFLHLFLDECTKITLLSFSLFLLDEMSMNASIQSSLCLALDECRWMYSSSLLPNFCRWMDGWMDGEERMD